MPAHNKNKRNVNLLIREGFEYSTAGRVLHWLLTAGRTIVVLTELVVIIAFLSRFWLDRTLNDLSEQNGAKKSQIESSAQFEKDFRSAQQRLQIYKTLDSTNVSASGTVKTVASLLPADVTISEINISEAKVLDIEGISLTENGVSGFLKFLSKNEKFKEVSLNDITLDTRGTQVIKFTIKAELGTPEKEGGK